MVVAPIELAQRHAFARPDQRAGRLEEQTHALDLRDLVLVMNRRVGPRLLEVLGVVHRRGDDLARVGDWAEQLHLSERPPAGTGRERLDARAPRSKVRDQRIVPRQRIARGRQRVERLADVEHLAVTHQPEPIVVEAANLHAGFTAPGCSGSR